MPNAMTTMQTINICADIGRQKDQSPPTTRLYRLLKIWKAEPTLLAINLRTCDLNFETKNQ